MTEDQRLEAAFRLKDNPYVESISAKGCIFLKKDFREALYFAWKFRQSQSTIEKMLVQAGLGWRVTGKEEKSKSLHKAFKKRFAKEKIKPDEQKIPDELRDNIRDKTKDELVTEGILKKSGRGYRFSDEFIELAKKRYPDFTPIDILYEWGIYPENVGSQIIDALMKKLEETSKQQSATEATVEVIASESQERQPEQLTVILVTIMQIPTLKSNPYIVKDSDGNEMLSEAFYNEAKIFLKYFDIKTILEAFGLTHEWINHAETLKHLRFWLPNDAQMKAKTILAYRIRGSKILLMMKAVDERFAKIKAVFRRLLPEDRKNVCLWISQLPEFPGREYYTRSILKKCGISKTVYYHYVGDPKYGLRFAERLEEDTRIVRAAFDYKGYRKGARQVCMLIPRITGKKMSYRKVCTIMKNAGMDCGIRKSSEKFRFKKETAEPNILQRKFRLYRPNQVRVTDVTYLFHVDENGKEIKSYGSALMDPVTGKIITFRVSDANNFLLVVETMIDGDENPCENGGIFHSDKGILYRLNEFKKMIKERGLIQSMSREGNCFDNAVIESFFGHFKDECDYSNCKNLEELRKVINDYVQYYNNERGRWKKERMTPVEYEKHLLAKTDEEWSEYLNREKKAYNERTAKAAEKAIERAKLLKAAVEKVEKANA